MAGTVPSVFVSSTFYDLKQLRADLAAFIEEQLGYRAMIAESQSFPVDADADTVENCRRRVDQDADILVLVIGRRYGTVDDRTAKSVTSLEYLTARAKGIPIYAFVEKGTLTLLEVWRADCQSALKEIVDNVGLFRFVEQLRSVDKIWVNPFDTAQDIISTLRVQFAYLMREGLGLLGKVHKHKDRSVLDKLGPKAFRIAVEQPKLWEYRLFSQVLADEVEACDELFQEHQRRSPIGSSEDIRGQSVPGWCGARANEIQQLIVWCDDLINKQLVKAFGPPGVPGEMKEIVFVARQIAMVYRRILEWSKRIRSAYVEDAWKGALSHMAMFPDSIIEQLRSVGALFGDKIEEALNTPAGERPREVHVSMKFEISHLDEYKAAFDQAVADLGM